MSHDFKNWPELRNGEEMELYYWQSPHKQITEDFRAEVVKVHDGDTVTVRWDKRDFDFPIRLAGINAPELSEEHGHEVRDWLENIILNQFIDVKVTKERVEKWGRVLATIEHNGIDMGDLMMSLGKATSWEQRHEADLPDINRAITFKWD